MFGPPPDTVNPPVRIVRAKRPPALLACGKCLRSAPAGREIKRALKAALAAGGGPGKPPRLARTACLGICPKGAVVVASPATLLGGEVVLVRGPADVEAARSVLLSKPDGPLHPVAERAVAPAGKDEP